MPTMPSPFPGMDPYVEPHWRDIHSVLISDARRELNRSLPKGLVARVEERVAVESDDDHAHGLSPDVRVFTPSTADRAETASSLRPPLSSSSSSTPSSNGSSASSTLPAPSSLSSNSSVQPTSVSPALTSTAPNVPSSYRRASTSSKST